MRTPGIVGLWALAGTLAWVSPLTAQGNVPVASTSARDGSHDFDFIVGTWKAHLKKLDKPLSGEPPHWTESDGTTTAIKLWGGSANLDQFEVGPIKGLTLRIYNPVAHQWSLYWATSAGGTIGVPTVGEFKNGKGEFYDQEEWHGRWILVRYEWSNITANSAHFEQAFSTDGGKTWEVNWISDQTRTAP